MKENIDRHLENLVDKAMSKSSLESPSLNFTNNVMAKVHSLGCNTATTYRPLISKPFWVAIGISAILIIIYSIFGTTTEETGWTRYLDFGSLSEKKLSVVLSAFKVSKIVMYSVVLFGIMILIQVPILKNYFDKRFEH